MRGARFRAATCSSLAVQPFSVFASCAQVGPSLPMAVVQFPVQQVRALVGALDREGFVVLSGPAGSGKLTLLQQAFPRLSVLRLEAEVNVTNVEKFARSLQPSMNEDGDVVQPIWAMGPAELVTQPAVATLRRIVLRRKQQVVLLSCEKVHGVAREAIVYHKGLDNEARVRLATNWGASAANVRNIVKACGTDLRQLQLAATFGSGRTDSAAHVWMDTQASFRGRPCPQITTALIGWSTTCSRVLRPLSWTERPRSTAAWPSRTAWATVATDFSWQ